MDASTARRAMHHRPRSRCLTTGSTQNMSRQATTQVLCIDPLTPDADYIGHGSATHAAKRQFQMLEGPDLCCGGFKWAACLEWLGLPSRRWAPACVEVVAGLGEDGCVYSYTVANSMIIKAISNAGSVDAFAKHLAMQRGGPPWLAHKALRVDVPTRTPLRKSCSTFSIGAECQ